MGFSAVSRVNDFLEIADKCLIFQDFELDPSFLWITLLKNPVAVPKPLRNQAFHQIARFSCNPLIPMKSIT
jgi:hypothetical protein